MAPPEDRILVQGVRVPKLQKWIRSLRITNQFITLYFLHVHEIIWGIGWPVINTHLRL